MKQNNKNKIGLGILLIAIVLFAGGLTYAFFRVNITETQEKLTVTTGTLELTFSDNNPGITASSLQFGESTTKEFVIKNTGTLSAKTNMLWNNLVNTYLKESLSYKLEFSTSATGPWQPLENASGNIPRSADKIDMNLATDITIPAKTTRYYRLTITLNDLPDVDQTSDISAVLNTSFKIGDKAPLTPTEKTLLALNKTVKTGTPNFTNLATEDETTDGLYSIEDDYGTSYYYRGAVKDNYVKFANKYWRIIRINGDGSVRMIYDGTTAHKNGEASTDRLTHTGKAWSSAYDDAKYVGWMYGGAKGEASTAENAQLNETNSDIKTLVDEWYVTNIVDKTVDGKSLNEYVADAGFCNDRTMPGKDVTGWDADTGLGYAKNVTGYGALARFVDPNKKDPAHGYWTAKESDVNPTLKCSSNDLFTTSSSTKGNKALTYPVGLITIDEASMAGGFYYNNDGVSNNNKYYLYKGSWYWSLSPRHVHTGGYANVFIVSNGGSLDLANVGDTYGAVAPVISLKAEYAAQLVGSGTATNPYQIPSQEVKNTLAALKVTPKKGDPTFNSIATEDEGVYAMADDYGTSYYYRGAVTNNYVKFANKYWRIIRINGDGSVRMIYDGTSAHANGEASADRLINNGATTAFNTSYDDNAYVGYMYGTVGSDNYAATHANTHNSTIKDVLDEWYVTNIANANLGQYVADVGFCSDRTTPGSIATAWTDDTGLGYANNATGYGAFARFVDPNKLDSAHRWTAKETGVTPKLTCTNSNDLFTTASSAKGNKALTYPVGLITMDEASIAGGFYYNGEGLSDNSDYYLYKGSWYWTLSPYYFNGSNTYVLNINGAGILHYTAVNNNDGTVAPVINISKEYARTLTGSGTMNSPFQIPGVE